MLLDIFRDIPPSDQPTNTFLALRPPWPISEQFHADAKKLCAAVRIDGNQRPFFILHITLLPIGAAWGRLPASLLEKLDAALMMVRFPAIDVVLDEARSFETRRDRVPFVLEGRDLTDVAALRLAASSALEAQDLAVPARQAFCPHLTLAYARRRLPRTRISPFCWQAREFQLIESWVGVTKYVELARWGLWDEMPPASPAAQQVLRDARWRSGESGAA